MSNFVIHSEYYNYIFPPSLCLNVHSTFPKYKKLFFILMKFKNFLKLKKCCIQLFDLIFCLVSLPNMFTEDS